MLRVIKPEGFGNIQLEEVPIPEVGPRDVLAKTHSTLISRGSELFARYVREDAVPPEIMGYSLSGVVERVGPEVEEFRPGQRVMISAPHAEYALGSVDGLEGAQVVGLPENLSFEEGTFLPFVISPVGWADSAGIKEGDTVVIVGQGLVGLMMLQVLRAYGPGRIVTIDALEMRRAVSRELGSDEVIDVGSEDPVAAVLDLTNGVGADVVMDCVGGYAGVKSFEQAQEMVRLKGTLQLIALYHGEPVPLDASKIMNRTLVAGIVTNEPRSELVPRAVEMFRSGRIRVGPMITHRFPLERAKDAFDLLWNSPGEALGVILQYQ